MRDYNKKDLGILFCPDLNFHSHIESICCKSFKTLGLVIRTINSSFKFSSSIKALYCALVRSILEYAFVWNPSTATNS